MSMYQLFDEVGETVRSLVPPELGELHVQHRSYGVKVWLGPAKQHREHYEAQVIGPAGVPDADVLALEVGFHAEHPDPAENEEVVRRLREQEGRWRKALGDRPELGGFLGGAEHWRRLSETWPDPDLSEPEIAFEVATRLFDFVTTLEPLRQSAPR
jgi:hypothetical protein